MPLLGNPTGSKFLMMLNTTSTASSMGTWVSSSGSVLHEVPTTKMIKKK